MRKSVVLIVFLLLFSSLSLGIAHGWVNQEKESITIDEKVLKGDKAFAEGLKVDCKTVSDNHLLWNTAYEIGQKSSSSTTFRFSQAMIEPKEEFFTAVFDVSIPFTGMGMSSSTSINLDEASFEQIREPLKDVASRTAAGERHKEQIYLKEYYDNYPLEVTFYNYGMTQEVSKEITSFFTKQFPIPISPDQKVEIEIAKNGSGGIEEINLSTAGDSELYPSVTTVSTKGGCYFSMTVQYVNGNVLPTPFPAECYGIMFLPFENDSEGFQGGNSNEMIPKVEDMKNVFPIDPKKSKILQLQVTDDQKTLLLLTKEEKAYFLTTIDRTSMKQLQKIALFDSPQEDMFNRIYLDERFLVPVLYNGQFVVLSKNKQGEYEETLRGNLSDAEEMWQANTDNLVMDYNGDSLAVLIPALLNASSSFYLSVFQPSGLVYAGQYENGLDKALIKQSSEGCYMNCQTDFMLTW